MPDLIDFLLYCFYNSNFKAEALGMKKSTATLSNMGIKLVEQIRGAAAREFAGQPSLHAAGTDRGHRCQMCKRHRFPRVTRPVRDGS